MHRKVIKFMLTLHDVIRMYHWITPSFSNHKATDILYNDLSPLIDRYVEVFISKFGRPHDQTMSQPIKLSLQVRTKSDLLLILRQAIFTLTRGFLNTVSSMDVGLSSTRDEMVASINRCIYLLQMM